MYYYNSARIRLFLGATALYIQPEHCFKRTGGTELWLPRELGRLQPPPDARLFGLDKCSRKVATYCLPLQSEGKYGTGAGCQIQMHSPKMLKLLLPYLSLSNIYDMR